MYTIFFSILIIFLSSDDIPQNNVSETQKNKEIYWVNFNVDTHPSINILKNQFGFLLENVKNVQDVRRCKIYL